MRIDQGQAGAQIQISKHALQAAAFEGVSVIGGVEITADMIEAATQVLQDAGRLSLEQDGLDHLLARSILQAALSKCRRAVSAASPCC